MTFMISIPKLVAQLNGRVIAPEDAGYDEARRVFYGSIDRRPAVIVRAADATDVSYVVSLARETGLELAVRSGGHSLAGHGVSEGGIVLDLSDMKALEIDVQRRTAWAQTGLTAWRPGSGTRDRSGSAGSRWAAASGTSFASMASRSTTCWPPSW
jgi:hypothetical protein